MTLMVCSAATTCVFYEFVIVKAVLPLNALYRKMIFPFYQYYGLRER